MKHQPLENQVIVVFGASSGIGRVTALLAAGRGAKVVAAGRDEKALDSLAGDSSPGRVVTTLAEAADAEEVRAVADQGALPHLRCAGGAYVVVSSEIAKRSFPLASSYSAAKHGVDGFVEALRVELQHEHRGVPVTQIMPAAIATPFFEHARTRLGVRPSGPPPVYTPEKVAKPSSAPPRTAGATYPSVARPRSSSSSSACRLG